MMAGFDLHSFCAHCREKKKGKDPCVEKPDSDSQHCKVLTPEQVVQLSTPSYKLRKEKRDKSDTTLLRIYLHLQSLSVPPLWTRHECR